MVARDIFSASARRLARSNRGYRAVAQAGPSVDGAVVRLANHIELSARSSRFVIVSIFDVTSPYTDWRRNAVSKRHALSEMKFIVGRILPRHNAGSSPADHTAFHFGDRVLSAQCFNLS